MEGERRTMRHNTTTINRRRILEGAALDGDGSLLLVACGGKNESGAKGAGTDLPSGSSGAASEDQQKEPVSGGTLSFSIGGDPPNFDVHSQSTYLVSLP